MIVVVFCSVIICVGWLKLLEVCCINLIKFKCFVGIDLLGMGGFVKNNNVFCGVCVKIGKDWLY